MLVFFINSISQYGLYTILKGRYFFRKFLQLCVNFLRRFYDFFVRRRSCWISNIYISGIWSTAFSHTYVFFPLYNKRHVKSGVTCSGHQSFLVMDRLGNTLSINNRLSVIMNTIIRNVSKSFALLRWNFILEENSCSPWSVFARTPTGRPLTYSRRPTHTSAHVMKPSPWCAFSVSLQLFQTQTYFRTTPFHSWPTSLLLLLAKISWAVQVTAHMVFLFCPIKLFVFLITGAWNQLRWLGHVPRMSQKRLTRQVLLAALTGKRPRGLSRTRWCGSISDLTLSRLGVEPVGLSGVSGNRGHFEAPSGCCPRVPRMWKWMKTFKPRVLVWLLIN